MLDPGSPALLRNLLQQSFKIPSVRLSYNYCSLPWREGMKGRGRDLTGYRIAW
jgi:hypothetical protein